MKIYSIVLSGISIFSITNVQANTIVGGYTNRILECVPTQPILGVKYGLVVQTQALAPEYFVRGAFFTSTGVYPGAETYYTRIDLQNQNLNHAFFNYGSYYKIILNKQDFTAQVTVGNHLSFICSERN